MKKLLRLSLALLVTLAAVTPARPQPPASRFFQAKDLMRVGVYYYPEHWPESQWDRDFANMERLGFEFVHMGEFAWAFIEPEEGRFDRRTLRSSTA